MLANRQHVLNFFCDGRVRKNLSSVHGSSALRGSHDYSATEPHCNTFFAEFTLQITTPLGGRGRALPRLWLPRGSAPFVWLCRAPNRPGAAMLWCRMAPARA